MNRGQTLRRLGAALQGRVAPDVDWLALLDLANRALVTPSLHQALKTSTAVPQDAATFMAEVAARSEARNQLLRRTAAEAVVALNAAGIEPVLLKGMALWASQPASAPFARMMSDVDLMVTPNDAGRAVSALEAAGFGVLARYPGSAQHVVAELGRPSDAGAVDLHQRPPGPPGMALAFDPDAHTTPSDWCGSVRVPSPAYQIYLMCLHDQFHDGGYWRGGFDLRHLQDIAELTRLPDGVDWWALEAVMPTRLARNAIHSELVAAREIMGADIPEPLRRLAPKLQYRRHLAQYRHPKLGLVFAGLGLLAEAPNLAEHRAVNRQGWRRLSEQRTGPTDPRWGLRPSRIRGLMKMRGGKI